jgi:hypothetical protein
MKTLLVNSLKTRISIVKEVKTSSATGAPIYVEELVKSVRAGQNEINVDEDEDGKIRVLFTTQFVIRYNSLFTKGKANAWMVIDADALKYNIVSVVEIGKPKTYLQINTVRRE